MIPPSPRKMKRSFDALTYVKSSRQSGQLPRGHQETLETWQRRGPDMQPSDAPKAKVDSHSACQPRPQVKPAFLRGRPYAAHGVAPRGRRGVIASSTQASSQSLSSFWPHFQRPDIGSEDFYDERLWETTTATCSPSDVDGSLSSGSPTVIKTTSVATQARAHDAVPSNSAASTGATWTRSASTIPDYHGNSVCEEANIECGIQSSRRESPAPERFPWQTFVTMFAFLMLTCLLTGPAIATVIEMKKMADPTDATNPDVPIGTGVKFYNAKSVAHADNIYAYRPKSLSLPRQLGIEEGKPRGHTIPTVSKIEHQGRGPIPRTDVFPVAKVVHATKSHTERDDAYLSSFNAANTSLLPSDSRSRPQCQDASFTYCQNSEPAFFYSPSTNSCLSVADDGVQLCSRGANKFASKRECHRTCVRHSPRKNDCAERTLFTACRREDVKTDLWYFDGNRCALWAFPSGSCPQNYSAVFATALECSKQCERRKGYVPCATPQTGPCAVKLQRFPFFAGYSAQDGHARCIKTSAAVLRGHRCLIGPNRFNSTEECDGACREPADVS